MRHFRGPSTVTYPGRMKGFITPELEAAPYLLRLYGKNPAATKAAAGFGTSTQEAGSTEYYSSHFENQAQRQKAFSEYRLTTMAALGDSWVSV